MEDWGGIMPDGLKKDVKKLSGTSRSNSDVLSTHEGHCCGFYSQSSGRGDSTAALQQWLEAHCLLGAEADRMPPSPLRY